MLFPAFPVSVGPSDNFIRGLGQTACPGYGTRGVCRVSGLDSLPGVTSKLTLPSAVDGIGRLTCSYDLLNAYSL